MTMASQDASNSYGFDGSFGYTCGSPWYLSQVVVPGTDYMPHCMWIDANGDQPTTGFQYVLQAPPILRAGLDFKTDRPSVFADSRKGCLILY